MEEKLRILLEYIHEKKGVWITPIPPQNERQIMLLDYMANIAKNYFETKKQNNG